MSVCSAFEKSLRLCHIVKWDHFDGYGFNLHAEKGKLGQYIGKVDEGSPAEAAGLKEGDRIIEVNGVNIYNENHKQVVSRIKAVPNETKLLVVDTEADFYFKLKETELNSSLPFVVTIKTPTYNEKTVVEKKDISIIENNGSSTIDSGANEEMNHMDVKDGDTNMTIMSSNEMSSEKNSQNQSLNLNMTAKELRAKLAAKKKYDPKKDYSLDVKKKYDIVQKL